MIAPLARAGLVAHAGLHGPEIAALAGGVLLPFVILVVVVLVTQRRDRARQGTSRPYDRHS